MTKLIPLIAVSIAIALPMLSYAQEPATLKYTSNLIGISINYPKNWSYIETGNNLLRNLFSHEDYLTAFIPSELLNLTNFNKTRDATFEVAKQQDLPVKNMPLDLYLAYVKKLQTEQGHNITSVEKVKLNNGTEAYKLNLTQGKSKGILILFNKSPESYYFFYMATNDKFNKYLPAVNRMIDSFTFNNNTFSFPKLT